MLVAVPHDEHTFSPVSLCQAVEERPHPLAGVVVGIARRNTDCITFAGFCLCGLLAGRVVDLVACP